VNLFNQLEHVYGNAHIDNRRSDHDTAGVRNDSADNTDEIGDNSYPEKDFCEFCLPGISGGQIADDTAENS
jgi:hypothetical protein